MNKQLIIGVVVIILFICVFYNYIFQKKEGFQVSTGDSEYPDDLMKHHHNFIKKSSTLFNDELESLVDLNNTILNSDTDLSDFDEESVQTYQQFLSKYKFILRNALVTFLQTNINNDNWRLFEFSILTPK